MADARIKQTVRQEPNINNSDHKSVLNEQKLSVRYGQILHTHSIVQVPPAGEDFPAGDRSWLELVVVGTVATDTAFWGTSVSTNPLTGTLVPSAPAYHVRIETPETVYCFLKWVAGTGSQNSIHWRSYGSEAASS